MKRYLLLLAAVLLLAGSIGIAGADDGPLADAGLDQTVGVDTTVQIDGTGSTHPDGAIEGYTWSIRTPDGRDITPDCRDCARTRFTPHETGRYEVTLTVTDAEDRTDTDTLYVDVEPAGPTVHLTGPTDPRVNESVSYNASATSTNTNLENLTWTIDNRTIAREPMRGDRASSNRSATFSSPDTYRLVVIVRDERNRTARDTLLVQPRDRPDPPSRDWTHPANTDGRQTDRDTTCSQAATVAGDYVCVATTDGDGGGVNVTSDPMSESCDGTDLSTCDPESTPGGGSRGGGDNSGPAEAEGRSNSGGSIRPERGSENAGSGSPGFVI